MRIAIDLMGNRNPPHLIAREIVEFSKELSDDVRFILIGKTEEKNFPKNFSYIEAKSIVSHDDSPLFAIKRKKDSSIAIAMTLLRDKKADAFISAGSTPALLSFGKLYLKTLEKISRPSLLALLPSKKNLLAVLDVGANISTNHRFLIEWAILGACFQNYRNIKKPKVALLNIGSEAKKGSLEIKRAYEILSSLSKEKPFNFIGNVEGNEVFKGKCDVVVTNGFTGNVFLKTSEGMANLTLDMLSASKEIKNFQDIQKYLHYEKYPGAILVGLDSIIIKCHGYSSLTSFKNSVKGAISLVREEFISSMKNYIKNYL